MDVNKVLINDCLCQFKEAYRCFLIRRAEALNWRRGLIT
jgi:hypothetical protein